MSVNGVMHPKTKAFADMVIANPKISNTEAYLKTHSTYSRAAASVEASRILKRPSVQIYMEKHVKKAKNRIVELIDSNREEIALKASDSVLDRVLGKPTSRSENVNLNISLEEAINMLD